MARPSQSHPMAVQSHKNRLGLEGAGSAYLPSILAQMIAEKAAQAPVPRNRWPFGRIDPGQPVPEYVAANDNGPTPCKPAPIVA